MTDWPFGDLKMYKYGAILADPPWDHVMRSAAGEAKSPKAHYDTMSLDAIKALPVSLLAGRNCLLFLWSTWPHLPQAMEVMTAWGFRYVSGGNWNKRTPTGKLTFGLGYVLRDASEPFLIGKFGAPERKSRSIRNVIEAAALPDTIESLRREHSRKPPEMRQIIDTLLPHEHACEIFAREPWEGRDVWGNQVGRFGVSA